MSVMLGAIVGCGLIPVATTIGTDYGVSKLLAGVKDPSHREAVAVELNAVAQAVSSATQGQADVTAIRKIVADKLAKSTNPEVRLELQLLTAAIDAAASAPPPANQNPSDFTNTEIRAAMAGIELATVPYLPNSGARPPVK